MFFRSYGFENKVSKDVVYSPTKFESPREKSDKSNTKPMRSDHSNISSKRKQENILIFTIRTNGSEYENAEIICNNGDFPTIRCHSRDANMKKLDTPFITDITAVFNLLIHYGPQLRNKTIKFNTCSRHSTFNDFVKSLDIERGLRDKFFNLIRKHCVKILIN